MNLKSVLDFAPLYEAFQISFGFSGARKKAIDKYLSVKAGDRILDIGCGPGKILTYLPDGVDYHGFDIDEGYIRHAKATYEGRGKFYCRPFDDTVLTEFRDVDLVMFNGVLHHLDDATARSMLDTSRKVLKSGGHVFTLDGCYRVGQNPLAKLLLDLDRGEFVRAQDEYERLLKASFDRVRTHTEEDISSLPYTFLIMVATK